MRRWWALLAVTVLLGGWGCSAILHFDQCNIDADCAALAAPGSTEFYCSGEHLCLNEYPQDRVECSLDATSSPKSGALTIGALVDRSRDGAILDGARLAVDEINQEQRRPLRFVVCETHGVPAQAHSALLKLANEWRAVVALGPTTTAEVLAVAPVAADRQVVVVTSEAGGDSLDDLDDKGFVWRLRPSDSLQTRVLASLLPDGTKNPVIAYSDDEYGQQLQAALVRELTTRAVPMPTPPHGISTPADGGGSSASEPAILVKSTPAVDAAFFLSDRELVAWVSAMVTTGVPPSLASLLLTETAKNDTLLSVKSSALLSLVSVAEPTFETGAHVDAFRAAFTGAYQTAPTLPAGRAYDTVYAISLAASILPATRDYGDGVREGMLRLSDRDRQSFDVGPARYVAAFDTLSVDLFTINLNGVSGPIDFDDNTGDVSTGPMDVWAVDTITMPAKPAWKRLKTVTP